MQLATPRLVLRSWQHSDRAALAAINADPRVMEHFPQPLGRGESDALIDRLVAHERAHGFTYFAAEDRADGRLLGFVGMARQDYAASFTPCVDIGWRLHPGAWGRGLATEGGRACLELAFGSLGLEEVVAVAVHQNRSSIRVMEKLGMRYRTSFEHPNLRDHAHLQPCVCYAIRQEDFAPGPDESPPR